MSLRISSNMAILAGEIRSQVALVAEPAASPVGPLQDLALCLRPNGQERYDQKTLGEFLMAIRIIADTFGYDLKEAGPWDRLQARAQAEQELHNYIECGMEVPPWM